ncbi:MAG: beta-propeller domain-containing protein [Myxococcota bacterium]
MRLEVWIAVSVFGIVLGCRTSQPGDFADLVRERPPSAARSGEFPVFESDRQVEVYLAESKSFRQAVADESAKVRRQQLRIDLEASAEELEGVFCDVEEMVVTESSEGGLLAPDVESVAFDAASVDMLGVAQFTPNLEVSSNESITNNQEFGVDEGDIVKRVGRYLIVLRRGQLYSVDMGRGPAAQMRVVDRQDVFPFSREHQAWYDELLVSDGHLFVLGFGYETEAAELAVFELGRRGGIKHRESYAIRSNDYYSGENYGARLVDGRLVFYLPLDLEEAEGEQGLSWPAYNTYGRSGELGDWAPLVGSLEILRPIQDGFPTLLHTIVECVFSDRGLDCSGVGMMGSWNAVHYVSRSATYLWVEGPRTRHLAERSEAERFSEAVQAAVRDWREDEAGVLFRLPFDGGPIGAIQLDGAPINQFSFREVGDELDVLLQTKPDRETERTSREWVRVALSRFDDRDAQASRDEVEGLPSAFGYCNAHRFVGEYLLYASCDGREMLGKATRHGVYAVHLESGRPAEWLETGADTQRIEPVGGDVVLVGETYGPIYGPSSLNLTPVLLGREAVQAPTLTLPDLTEAEGRSHAFNYTSNGDGDIVFGLPANRAQDDEGEKEKDAYSAWWNRTWESEIAYFSMSERGAVEELGSLFEDAELLDEDECSVSCVDWYGSLRPIFLEGRVFALMGNSLVEGVLGRRGIREVQRLSLARD